MSYLVAMSLFDELVRLSSTQARESDLVSAVVLGLCAFAWVGFDARERNIELPGGSALLAFLFIPVGVPVYLFRALGLRRGFRGSLKAFGFMAIGAVTYVAVGLFVNLLGWSQIVSLRAPTVSKEPDPPPGWTKTLKELNAEEGLPKPWEVQWAISYEHAQLKKWARFPRDGEVFEALGKLDVGYEINWDAPVSSGGTATLAQGTRVRVTVFDQEPEPVTVNAVPLEYGLLEQQIIPEEYRVQSKYAGYNLSITTEDLNKLFRRVPKSELSVNAGVASSSH
jgi:hypothetical protein